MPSDPLNDATTALITLGGQRVWSLLVSVFGDLAPGEGTGIRGPVLSAIMTGMNVRAEATRVALHRLRNDGWITSEKSGRTSLHGLTDFGRTETQQASLRIYAGPHALQGNWRILLMADAAETTEPPRGFLQICPRVFIGPAGDIIPENAMALTGTSMPLWLRRDITPADLCADYATLHRILLTADQALPDGTPLPPTDRAVLRCLIVHNWRRLLLRHPDLPAALYTPDWRAPECRVLVNRLLQRFPRPNLADLSP